MSTPQLPRLVSQRPSPSASSLRAHFSQLGKLGLMLTVTLPCLLMALQAADAPAVLRIATVAPKGSSFHSSLQAMGQRWKAAPGGGVSMDVYAQSQGGESAIVRRMRINQLQGAMLTAAGMGQIDKSVTALQMMPMMFRSWEEVDLVREKLRPRLEKAFLDKGFVVLFWGDAGWVRWFSKGPIVRPTDLKPLKVYTSSGDPESVEIMKDYYFPVVLETDKIFSSLSTDMINAIPIPAFLGNALQIAPLTTHMLDLKWVPVVGAMVLTTTAWDKLSPETRAVLKADGEKTGVDIRNNSRNEDNAAIAVMQEKQKLKVQAVTPALEEEWAREIAKTYPKVRGSVVPAPFFDEVVAILKTHRASKASTP